jgi:hypothetical protein
MVLTVPSLILTASGGLFSAAQFMIVDETLKKFEDIICPYGYAPVGQRAEAKVWFPPSAECRWSGICSMSIERCQSVHSVNTAEETINAQTFLSVLRDDIMPLMTPCPGKRSILPMDNCRIHQKPAIYALCAAKGVLFFCHLTLETLVP